LVISDYKLVINPMYMFMLAENISKISVKLKQSFVKFIF